MLYVCILRSHPVFSKHSHFISMRNCEFFCLSWVCVGAVQLSICFSVERECTHVCVGACWRHGERVPVGWLLKIRLYHFSSTEYVVPGSVWESLACDMLAFAFTAAVPVKVCRLWELFALRVHDSIVAFYTVISFMCLIRALKSCAWAWCGAVIVVAIQFTVTYSSYILLLMRCQAIISVISFALSHHLIATQAFFFYSAWCVAHVCCWYTYFGRFVAASGVYWITDEPIKILMHEHKSCEIISNENTNGRHPVATELKSLNPKSSSKSFINAARHKTWPSFLPYEGEHPFKEATAFAFETYFSTIFSMQRSRMVLALYPFSHFISVIRCGGSEFISKRRQRPKTEGKWRVSSP